ncbi:kinase-like protein [Trichodelitschia bisporula]|uniref:non-specific serine/threonine protein kinase n=1 Tax=Trichodelitschia bisporula TaxID=703511 RepID=A0A6G1I2W2_9PEZI|nr:kinase-like protein [Trichodelitschia bisporula]
MVRVLGKGSFGVVRLVREKKGRGGGEVFAMKVIRKTAMLRASQEGHLRAERDFLVQAAGAKWVVPLVAAFQDARHLYLVMEYQVGGDFLGLLLREDVLPEAMARWYVAEMVMCVEEAHRLRWLHRDVKPDNFLISAEGHLRISDFGLAFDGHWAHHQAYFNATREGLLERLGIVVLGDAEDRAREAERENAAKKHGEVLERRSTRPEGDGVLDRLDATGRRRLAKSVVGTSQYMAPEVIRGEMYDGRCDWWSVGIILYECLYGSTPFYCDKREETKAKILHHDATLTFPISPRYHRPSHGPPRPLPPVSTGAIHLIRSLLQDRPYRLSNRAYRLNDAPRSSPTGTRMRRLANAVSHTSLHTTSNSGSPPPRPSAPFFVCPDSGADIKAHPFFRGLNWATLHQQRPPWVPRLAADQPITQWFEPEAEILGVGGDAGSEESDEWDEIERAAEAEAEVESQPRAGEVGRLAAQCGFGDGWLAQKEKGVKKERKRARDKILRDPKTARAALEVRRQGAFLGYTYRRAPGEGTFERRGVQGFWGTDEGVQSV